MKAVRLTLTPDEASAMVAALDGYAAHRCSGDCAGPGHEDGCDRLGWTEYERNALARGHAVLIQQLAHPEEVA